MLAMGILASANLCLNVATGFQVTVTSRLHADIFHDSSLSVTEF
jgi:hypothetical protein